MPLSVSTVTNVLVKLRRARHDAIDLCSGPPLTHPALGECKGKVPLAHGDRYVCTGAVDMTKLLRSSRASLYDKAVVLGANVLVDESWECRIRIPKHREGKFRVQIRYYASASRSAVPDPRKPVALDRVHNVPGLMTIVCREEMPP